MFDVAGLGPTVPFPLIFAAWLGNIVLVVLICTFLVWLGIRVLDALTPKIAEREKIAGNSVATGLYVAGFLVFIGLIIHGAMSAPVLIGPLHLMFDFRRMGLVIVSFFVTLFLSIALFNLMDKLTAKISFTKINENPIAIGVYVFGYFIFFGLIIHAALTMPL